MGAVLSETDKFDLEWIIQTLAKERCTIYMGVSTMLDAISNTIIRKG